MKVTVGNKQFIIGWQYGYKDVVLGGGRLAAVPQTTCTLSEIMPDNTLQEIAKATVGAHSSDVFDKNRGRKTSLERVLLQQVPVPVPGSLEPNWVPLFQKNDREDIWMSYFKMRNGKW
jgi:hypothetical protein